MEISWNLVSPKKWEPCVMFTLNSDKDQRKKVACALYKEALSELLAIGTVYT